MSSALRFSLLAVLTLTAASAHARQADRTQPMEVIADQVQSTLGDASPTRLTGHVVITQGSMTVQADAGTLQTHDGDITHANFTGAPAVLDQEMDDGAPINAIAKRMEYDLATDTLTLMGGVVVKKPTNTLQGERVVYNMTTGQISADGEGGSGRVKMHILPRPQNTAP